MEPQARYLAAHGVVRFEANAEASARVAPLANVQKQVCRQLGGKPGIAAWIVVGPMPARRAKRSGVVVGET